jgi:predicted site-specific integrase-resolvase
MEWVTRKEASERLRCHIGTIDRYIKSGRLEASWVSAGMIRVSVYSIDRLLQQGKR